MSEWIKAISKLVAQKAETVPEGWQTMEEISKEINKSLSQATKKISEMRTHGLVDTQKFILCKDGRCYPVQHYKIKKKK